MQPPSDVLVAHRYRSRRPCGRPIDVVKDQGELVGVEPGQATGGGEYIQPLLARVGALPVEPPVLRDTEVPRLVNMRGGLGVSGLAQLQDPN